MKAFRLFLLLTLLLSACSGIPPTTLTVERQTSNVRSPTQTPIPTLALPTNTLTPTASPPPTAAASETSTSNPCDPLLAYCLETGHFMLERPIAPPGLNTIDPGYPYGTTEGGARDPHHGVEFVNASGTPVLAAADGTVVVAGDDSQQIYAIYPNSYGNLIVIEHHFQQVAAPIYTVYGHLSKVEVQAGQSVHAGEEIGQVGSSGAAIGSHLHFEVREGQNTYDSNRNPILWLKPLQTSAGPDGVLAGRLQDSQGNPIYIDVINIQYFPDPNGAQSAAWQVETYASEEHPVQADDAWQENFALGDLTPGDYRFSLMWNGQLVERWVKVLPNQLTFFVVQVNP